MNTQHTKSPCCRASIQRFGERRRRCAKCHRTWRIRKKRKGRKPKRTNRHLVFAYLEKKIPSMRRLAEKRGRGRTSAQRAVRKSLESYVNQEYPHWQISLRGSGSLIAIADAIWYHIKGEPYTIYIILLRPIKSTEAIICPPAIIPGHEDFKGWEQAFGYLPNFLKRRIIALVCDGATTLVTLARLKRWVIQRCHFHLIAAVQNYLSTGPRSKNHSRATYVLGVVQGFLHTNNPERIKKICRKIQAIRRASTSRGLRRVLSGLLVNYKDYHAYLEYPRLNLPATSNSAESFIQCIRDLMYRCRGFRSYRALTYWLIALSLFKKTIRCNGKKSTNF